MIRVYVKPNGAESFHDEFQDVAALFKNLDTFVVKGATVLVRVPGDKDFLDILETAAKGQDAATRAATMLAGSMKHCWQVTQQWVDIDGWRLMLSSVVLQANAQQGRRS